MDSLITAAARALAAGDPLAALKQVALRDDAPALALRGIAMAQLGDLVRAKALLKQAVRAFGPREVAARARCVVAEAEIALVSRDLSWPSKALRAAGAALEMRGDVSNAAHARNIEARRLLLIGRLDEADALLAEVDPLSLLPAARTVHHLVVAGIAIRRLQSGPAHAALRRARAAADEAGIPPLTAEVEAAARVMTEMVARLVSAEGDRPLQLAGVEEVLASDALVFDALRNIVRAPGVVVSLSTRPVLFALARALGEAWPAGVSRGELIARAFSGKEADESHRARLRVEISRLRAALASAARITATGQGFVLQPRGTSGVAVLAPPADGAHGAVLALLADGEAWASSALAIALAESPRTVQRALAELAADGKVQSFGGGRSLRWILPPVPGFPTSLLLPRPLPGR